MAYLLYQGLKQTFRARLLIPEQRPARARRRLLPADGTSVLLEMARSFGQGASGSARSAVCPWAVEDVLSFWLQGTVSEGEAKA